MKEQELFETEEKAQYSSTHFIKPVKEKTALCEIESEHRWRRANGAYELVRLMNKKPERGKSYHILSGGNVDLLSHVLWLQLYYKKIKYIFLVCWTISINDLLYLKEKHDNGEIDNIEILLGDLFPKKFKREWDIIQKMYYTGFCKNVYVGKIHSKVMLLEMENGEKIVIESSANCNMNPRIEQSCITVSDELYGFYNVYLHELLNDVESRETARTIYQYSLEEDGKIDNDERSAILRQDDMGD